MTVLFNSSSVSVTEGSSVAIQLIAQGIYNQGFTVNLRFQDGTGREYTLYSIMHSVHVLCMDSIPKQYKNCSCIIK